MKNHVLARPVVKWAGGKKKVIKHIMNRLPASIETFYEPMVGGGFVLFYLANLRRFKKAIISDVNPELINAYRVIKKDVESLIQELSKSRYAYNKQTFLEHRAADTDSLDAKERAARFIYLNKTCFNGLYRVNKDGKFNTPFGTYTNPQICDTENLRAVSKCLKNVKILQKDFEEVCTTVTDGDAVYFDPPYIPLSKTSNFTSYTSGGFGLKEHIRLQNCFSYLADRNARIILSNSCAPEALELYQAYDMDIITGPRNVGGPAEYRKSVSEMLVFAGKR